MVLRALVIDPQPDMRRIVSLKLRAAGIAVSTALDGEEGLEKASAERPDIVILGALLPRRDSLSVACALKRQAASSPPIVILLSPEMRMVDISAGLLAGADDYMAVPFAPRHLLERIAVALIKAGRLAQIPDTFHIGTVGARHEIRQEAT